MAEQPQRIQRSRAKGWRMPPGAIYVGRPSRWGNPYVVGHRFWPLPHNPIVAFSIAGTPLPEPQIVSNAAHAVELFRLYWQACLAPDYPSGAECRRSLRELRGHDLCCWCALDQPCHADVLLDLANRDA